MTSLTFDEICPKWDNRLYPQIKQKEINRLIPDLEDWSKCVVGEAYAQRTKYIDDCRDCYIYAVKFHSEAAKEATYDKQFEPLKKDFAEHWNRIHLGYK